MHINKEHGKLVADCTSSSVDCVNKAILENLSLFSVIVEVSEQSEVPIKYDQELVEKCSESIADLVVSRRKIANLISSMRVLQKNSNLKETSFGCPDGFHGSLKNKVEANASDNKV